MKENKPMPITELDQEVALQGELNQGFAAADAEQDATFQSAAPTGNFTVKSLNNLVGAVNKVLPFFGDVEQYPTFSEDIVEFPQEFVRVLSMVGAAADDAITAEVLEPDMTFSLDEIVDDASLTLVASKLTQLSASKDFKKWLSETPPEEEAVVEETAAVEGDVLSEPEDVEALFSSRM